MPTIPELRSKNFILLALGLALLNTLAWIRIFSPQTAPGFYFLDVGQGDSELSVMPNGTKILTDAGPGRGVTERLDAVLGSEGKYIDLAIISHPQLDHYGGFRYILDSYDIGAILWTGREPDKMGPEWTEFIKKAKARSVRFITVLKGDRVLSGAGILRVLSPNNSFASGKNANESAIVEKITINGISALFTADIDKKVETSLASLGKELRAEILKVAHHGSKYSSDLRFISSVSPSLSVIEVGARNTYGHPTEQVLKNLSLSGSTVLRTDLYGTISVLPGEDGLLVSTEKSADSRVN